MTCLECDRLINFKCKTTSRMRVANDHDNEKSSLKEHDGIILYTTLKKNQVPEK